MLKSIKKIKWKYEKGSTIAFTWYRTWHKTKNLDAFLESPLLYLTYILIQTGKWYSNMSYMSQIVKVSLYFIKNWHFAILEIKTFSKIILRFVFSVNFKICEWLCFDNKAGYTYQPIELEYH